MEVNVANAEAWCFVKEFVKLFVVRNIQDTGGAPLSVEYHWSDDGLLFYLGLFPSL